MRRAAVSFWNDPSHAAAPAWANLRTDAVAPYAGDAGQCAIGLLCRAAIEGARRAADLPENADAPHHYASLLVIMTRLARCDTGMAEREEEAATPASSPASFPASRRAPSPARSFARAPVARPSDAARLVSFPAPSRF